MKRNRATQPHKSSGEAALPKSTRVEILEYVCAGREGIVIGRTDSDGPDSANWYEYEVRVPSLGRNLYFTEYEVRDAEIK